MSFDDLIAEVKDEQRCGSCAHYCNPVTIEADRAAATKDKALPAMRGKCAVTGEYHDDLDTCGLWHFWNEAKP